jgi:hypothetical protein
MRRRLDDNVGVSGRLVARQVLPFAPDLGAVRAGELVVRAYAGVGSPSIACSARWISSSSRATSSSLPAK